MRPEDGKVHDFVEHITHVMAAAARGYGRGVLAPRTPAGADETQAVGCQLFRLLFGGRALDDDLAELLDTAGSGTSARHAPDEDDDTDEDLVERKLLNFVIGALNGLPELRPAALNTLAAFYRRKAGDGAVRAMTDLGDLLRSDDFAGSRDAYARAVATGDARALISLAELLNNHGDTEGAQRYLRRAAAAGNPDVAAEALVTLGYVLEASDPAAAEAALREAIETGHRDWAPCAMSDLGGLRGRRGDYAGARAAYQMAIDSAGPGWAASASESLATMLEEQGDVAGAKAAYLRAVMADEDYWRPSALHGLLDLLKEEGDLDGVRALHQAVAQAGRDWAATEALLVIGQLLEQRGDHDGARAAYRRAAEAGDDFAEALLARLEPSPETSDEAAEDAEPVPAQFDPRNAMRTGAEVLERGLPPLPDVLSYQMAIPVAYWIAQRCAVVLFLRFSRHGRGHYPTAMQVTYERGEEGWTAHRHAFGTSFSHDPIANPGDRRHLGGNRMTTGGSSRSAEVTPGHPAAVQTGSASSAVRYIALIQDGREDRRPLDSHFGAWVVCTESPSPFQVAGYDENGSVLARVG